MAIICLLISVVAGTVVAAITWTLGGGLIWCLASYALSGQLVFFFLLRRLTVEEDDMFWNDEVQKDMLALRETEAKAFNAQPEAPVALFSALRKREAELKRARDMGQQV